MISRSPEDTYNLGRKIGESLNPGAVIALTGDLGSGKTAFVQGLARGLGVPQEYYITSPTYTLVNEYPGRCPLFHADLYRLEGNADIEEIGLYDILQKGEGVTAVEWAERLDKETLSAAIRIRFEILDEESRRVVIEN
ncbi:MAG: tRNA (adenosine(37)-N6)-threonylcarbamoyltransferase complex ATPase subunit type 1 TsaE [Desulfobacteraceae bacterium IS3]|nr:MAG: tRNA (adenosine(37)-N6)-threonylcarbamoyltransferase complex ATPase subunit type 1 TsaE [Desulfobacteraceae bacterium IS3]